VNSVLLFAAQIEAQSPASYEPYIAQRLFELAGAVLQHLQRARLSA